MHFAILLALLVCQLYSPVPIAKALEDHHEQPCPFRETVNLTDVTSYDNGSYSYQGILIPPEKQKYYDYELKFHSENITVPKHLRGCICDDKPCLKLCCNPDEYFDDENSVCEILTPDMKVSWDVLVESKQGGKTKTVNIFKHFTTHVGLPCNEPEGFNSEYEKWMLRENGILFVEADNSEADSLDFCYSPLWNNETEEFVLTPFSCAVQYEPGWKLLLNTYAMTISVIFLIPTILVYLVCKELRKNLRGKLLICYLLSLTMGYAIISFINISRIEFKPIPCKILGFTCYFFFMAAFLWLSVLCFDILKNFNLKTNKLDRDMRRKIRRQFIWYSLYAWLSAGLATMIAVFVEHSSNVHEIYKPGIGADMCWLNVTKWSAALYFYGPTLVILLLNFATFAHLSWTIYRIRRDIATRTHMDKFFKENAIIVLRLFIIMGIAWIFDVLSYILRDNMFWDFLFVLSDFANAIQGILIFSLFVVKPKVWELLKKKFCKDEIGLSPKSMSTSVTNVTRSQSLSPGPQVPFIKRL